MVSRAGDCRQELANIKTLSLSQNRIGATRLSGTALWGGRGRSPVSVRPAVKTGREGELSICVCRRGDCNYGLL